MITESYYYVALGNNLYYYFQSEGKQGKIDKIVTFSLLKNKYWNLAFGDLQGQRMNDSVVSNNHDIVKLISTVAKIAYDFSDRFPKRGIEITPVDEKRKRLYNHVFRRNYDDIDSNFHIIGLQNDVAEKYSPEKSYDKFRLKRKFAEWKI
jgi:hypothetical protein